MSEFILPEDVRTATQQSATDIADAMNSLRELALIAGGEKVAAWARNEVAKLVYQGLNQIEAASIVYKRIVRDDR